MAFTISSQYINKRCGLHLKEYQKPNPNNPSQLGIINRNGKFTACNCREHITKEKYVEIIPKIIDELTNAGFYETLKFFEKDANVLEIFSKLKADQTTCENITAQKTTKSNTIIRCYQKHFYDVKNHKGESLNSLWTKENLIKAFNNLDKPNYTVNSSLSEIIRRVKFNPVTIYSPIMTKSILDKYNCRTIFDPCIGWGGRMVGTASFGSYEYIGCEPCVKTYEGLKNICNKLGINAEIHNKPVEDAINNELTDKTFDMLLTSPPYYDLEVYSNEDTQSINRYPSYQSWIENFIKPIIEYSDSHVTKYCCWSVKNFKTDQSYNLKNDIEEIYKLYGWELIDEISIKKNTNSGTTNGDTTYVFKKVIGENIEGINNSEVSDNDNNDHVEDNVEDNNGNIENNIDGNIENIEGNIGHSISEVTMEGDNVINSLIEYSLNYVLDKIPDNLTEDQLVIYKLISDEANNNSSGFFREKMTCEIANYNQLSGKLGYDAEYNSRLIEIKPQNVIDDGGKKKLNGHGNFSDFTHKRFDKYIKDNILMCVSGFYKGKIMYIVSFDFNSPKFIEKMKRALYKHLPNGDESSKYCRSGCSFTWKLWEDANNLKLVKINENISTKCVSKPFLIFLNSLK